MNLDNLTELHLVQILRLYEQHCGFGRDFIDVMYQSPCTVLEHLREQGEEEYRIGSRWDVHSKIYFETDLEGNVVVRFNSNLNASDRTGNQYRDAEKMGEAFEKAAMQYLISQ